MSKPFTAAFYTSYSRSECSAVWMGKEKHSETSKLANTHPVKKLAKKAPRINGYMQ